MEQNKLVIQIFGQQLSLKSSADPEYTSELAEYVDGQIRKVSRQSNDPLKVVLLASMNIANELFEELKGRRQSEDAVSQRADSLCELLRRAV